MNRKIDRKNRNRRVNRESQNSLEESSDHTSSDVKLESVIDGLANLIKRSILAIDRQLSRIEQIEEEKAMESEQGAYMERFFDCEFAFGNR